MHQAAGRAAGDVTRAAALDHLADGIAALGEGAAGRGHPPFYEPLNRHETNLFNRQAEAADFIRGRALGGVRLLCDLFHVNIEEDFGGGGARSVRRPRLARPLGRFEPACDGVWSHCDRADRGRAGADRG